MADSIPALLAAAREEGWVRSTEALPRVGERVDVMHVLSRSYDCDGEVDHEGQWRCCNGFILPNMILTFAPTHWRAKQPPSARTGGQSHGE